MGGFADDEVLVHFHAQLAQAGDFEHEADRINDHAVADDAELALAQDAGRHQVQDIPGAADENRVPGVVATGVSHHEVRPLGQYVNNLALALIAPLGANENRVCHSLSVKLRGGFTIKIPERAFGAKLSVFAGKN